MNALAKQVARLNVKDDRDDGQSLNAMEETSPNDYVLDIDELKSDDEWQLRRDDSSKKNTRKIKISSKLGKNPKKKEKSVKEPTTLIEHLDVLLSRQLKRTTPKQNIVRVPEVFARIRTCEGQKPEIKTIRVLLDSGASASLIRGDFTKKLKHERTMKPVRWQTRGGSFNTTSQCTIQFALPEFSDQKLVTWKVYSDDTPSSSLKYDMMPRST